MKARKMFFAVAVLCTVGLSTSCSKSDIIAEEEALIIAKEQEAAEQIQIDAAEQQAVDRDEVKNEDT